jgi:drug/metabolite transporter (DMT)-like permease
VLKLLPMAFYFIAIIMDHKRYKQLWPGVPFAIAAAIAFGFSTPAAKILLGTISPLMLAGLLYLGSGFGLSVIIAFRKFDGSSVTEAGITRGDLPWLFGTILFGGVLGPILLLIGLSTTDAAAASLLLNLESVLTLLLAWLVFREQVDHQLFIGAVAIVAGATILSWQGEIGKFSWGTIMIALACFSWAIDNNLTRKISTSDPYVLAAIKGVCAGSVNMALAIYAGANLPTFAKLAGAMSLGFVSYGLGLVLFIYALRHLGTARTSTYYGTAPFIGAFAATIFFGSPITPIIIAAGLLMAIGAWLHLTEHHEHDHTHIELDHNHAHSHDVHHQHIHEGEVTEPHTHAHHHTPTRHKHAHYPDAHHRHEHD